MTHATHGMSHTAYPTHSMHDMEPRMGRSKARSAMNPSHSIHLAAMTLAYVTGTLAMDLLAVNSRNVGCHDLAFFFPSFPPQS